MNNEKLPIRFAPLQGYTDAPYRRAHARLFGGIDAYYSPFVRVEHGQVRRKEVRDIDPDNNRDLHLIPQLIAPDCEKMISIMDLFVEKGYREANINLGCSFPLLAKRGNGAGMLPYPDRVEQLLRTAVERYPDVRFSIKMRLGWQSADECLRLLPLLNDLPLSHLILHPRLGSQGYKEPADVEAFHHFYDECRLPLFYNGDLQSADDLHRISQAFPRLAGLVIGRGLLANPALALEYREGAPLPADRRMELIHRLHADLFSQYGNLLEGGDLQLLAKMRTFWEYLLPEGNRKAHKIIRKTTKLSNYLAAVERLLSDY